MSKKPKSKIDPEIEKLFYRADKALDSLHSFDNIDQGLILCFALVQHMRRYNPTIKRAKFLSLIENTLSKALDEEI